MSPSIPGRCRLGRTAKFAIRAAATACAFEIADDVEAATSEVSGVSTCRGFSVLCTAGRRPAGRMGLGSPLFLTRTYEVRESGPETRNLSGEVGKPGSNMSPPHLSII